VKMSVRDGPTETSTEKPNTGTVVWNEDFALNIGTGRESRTIIKLLVGGGTLSSKEIEGGIFPVGEVWDLWIPLEGNKKCRKGGSCTCFYSTR
jgi:hypothetical protein